MTDRIDFDVDFGPSASDLDSLIEEQLQEKDPDVQEELERRKEEDDKAKESSQEKLYEKEDLDELVKSELERNINESDEQDEDDYQDSKEESEDYPGQKNAQEDAFDEEGEEGQEEEGEEENNQSEWSETFELLRDEGLLFIPDGLSPDDLNEETLEELKAQTFALRDRQIYEARRDALSDDPYKQQVLDFLYLTDGKGNLPEYKETLDEIRDYSTIDIESEENQRAILKDFLTEGLDPENPAHKFRLSKVDDEVEEIISDMKGKNEAEKAKEYFTQKSLQKKQQLEQEAQARLAEEARAQEEARREAEMWHNQLQQTVLKQQWDETKKQEILSQQYNQVQIEDGSYAPMWWVKENYIKRDPNLYSIYLDFLSSFDIEKGTFKNQSFESPEQKVQRKILQMAKKRKSSKSPGSKAKRRNNKIKGSEIVDPLDNL